MPGGLNAAQQFLSLRGHLPHGVKWEEKALSLRPSAEQQDDTSATALEAS